MAISAAMLDRKINLIRRGTFTAEITTTSADHTEAIGAVWTGGYHVQVQAPVGATVVIIGLAPDGITPQTETIPCKSGLIMSENKYAALTSVRVFTVTIGDTFTYLIVDAFGVPGQAIATATIASGIDAYIGDDDENNSKRGKEGDSTVKDKIVMWNYASEALAPKKGDLIVATDYPNERIEIRESNLLRSITGRHHFEVFGSDELAP